jgi:hypothetical protein
MSDRYPARVMAERLSSSQVAALLDELCVDYGFCLPPHEKERLKTEPPSEVDAFTDAVFGAEGMDPWRDLHLRSLVKKRVAKAFRDAGEPTAG